MADTKLSALDAAASVEATDRIFVVKDPSGTPLDRAATAAQFLTFIQESSAIQTTSASDPTVNNDTTEGYRVGDFWFNSTTGAIFQIRDVTDGAAVWKHVSTRWQTIDTQTPTGSATISLPASGSLSSLYNDVLVEIEGLQHNDGSNRNISLQISDDGTNWSAAVGLMTANVAASTSVYGQFEIKNYRSTNPKQYFGSVHTAIDTLNNTVRHAYISTETGVMTHMRLVWGAGTNIAGTVRIKAR